MTLPSCRIIPGDVLAGLATLPDASVHCCVTSPPYWGLRDYGVEGQIGLEPTPAEYVAKMVAVFREVRRVLKDDGVLFLNLGDSYVGAGYSNHANTGGARREDGGKQKHSVVARAPACDSDDRAPRDSTERDCSSSRLCGACRAAISGRTTRSDAPLSPEQGGDSLAPNPARTESAPAHLPTSRSALPTPTLRSGDAKPDQPRTGDLDGAQPSSSPESKPERSSSQHQAECSRCANCGACLRVDASVARDARLCVCTASCRGDIGTRGSDDRRIDTDASASAYLDSTTAYRLKPKDLCGIPWRVAFALQADGWYLRSDIIWSKPNPMPESVTDRPTKAHEYLFLLSKSKRYHYDYAAVAEAAARCADDPRNRWDRGYEEPPGQKQQKRIGRSGNTERKPATERGCPNDGVAGNVPWEGTTRNKRTVWTIPTEPFPGAHFAVMPTALVKPCILAGCPTGGTVLDPFGGSGTVAVVALEHGCSAVLCELNPAYCEIIRQRVGNVTPAMLLDNTAPRGAREV